MTKLSAKAKLIGNQLAIPNECAVHKGLTKRELFIGLTLLGASVNSGDPKVCAEWSIKVVDAVLGHLAEE